MMMNSIVEIIDITEDFVKLRYIKSSWEIKQIREAFKLADFCYDAMKKKIRPGISEIEVASSGEYAARSRGASGFGFSVIVGSGKRSNAGVPIECKIKIRNTDFVGGIMGEFTP